MLTAERLETETDRGLKTLKWVLPGGRRNEALDCRCYAIAGLNIANPSFDQIADAGGPRPVQYSKPKQKRNLSNGIKV